MKKVLSVALASAMVLGMGANAFAIQYNSGSNDKADWPDNFKFDGALFVTDKNGDIITDATTDINDNEDVDFQPGDVIWMPLYADDQLSYDANWSEGKDDVDAISDVRLDNSKFRLSESDISLYYDAQAKEWWSDSNANGGHKLSEAEIAEIEAKGFKLPTNPKGGVNKLTKEAEVLEYIGSHYQAKGEKIVFDGVEREVKQNSLRFYINGKQYKTVEAFNEEVAKGHYTTKEAYAVVDLVKIEGTDDQIGKPNVDSENGHREYGHYTGNIDKNWSINLIEKSTGVAELVEKAELYKATAKDYASYSKYTDEIMPKAVYLKVTLKKEWKTVSDETMKYYVYVSDNDGSDKTNEVWVSGKYAPETREVDFTWTNDANEPALWEAKESGVAVFDFADKAFFTVKMYKGETMYLDLETAYDKAIAGEMDADADSFYKFDKSNSSFSRAGELVIVSDDETLVPYEIDEDGNFVAVDAEYVKDYAIAHTNSKVNGFVFNTKQLGNYVLATEELGEEAPVEDGTDADENTVTPEPEVEEKPQTDKPNPNTGANDFVGLAVSLAVVSVAAAGALALKK